MAERYDPSLMNAVRGIASIPGAIAREIDLPGRLSRVGAGIGAGVSTDASGQGYQGLPEVASNVSAGVAALEPGGMIAKQYSSPTYVNPPGGLFRETPTPAPATPVSQDTTTPLMPPPPKMGVQTAQAPAPESTTPQPSGINATITEAGREAVEEGREQLYAPQGGMNYDVIRTGKRDYLFTPRGIAKPERDFTAELETLIDTVMKIPGARTESGKAKRKTLDVIGRLAGGLIHERSAERVAKLGLEGHKLQAQATSERAGEERQTRELIAKENREAKAQTAAEKLAETSRKNFDAKLTKFGVKKKDLVTGDERTDYSEYLLGQMYDNPKGVHPDYREEGESLKRGFEEYMKSVFAANPKLKDTPAIRKALRNKYLNPPEK